MDGIQFVCRLLERAGSEFNRIVERFLAHRGEYGGRSDKLFPLVGTLGYSFGSSSLAN
jgi:hypothetical protein